MTKFENQDADIVAQAAEACVAGDIVEGINMLLAQFPARVCFSTSFSWEDQALTHLIFSNDLDVKVFTLDTGRLFPETYSTWSSTLERYSKTITAYYPDANALQEYVAQNGPNAFYESTDLRRSCCFIRKVAPLQIALQDQSVWITGIRAAHSNQRDDLAAHEWDETNHVFKLHPLLHWQQSDLLQFIRQYEIPYNPLQDRGFVSIGCAPCTRAIRPGEDFRAGRWWWESADKKECGLHIHR